MIDFDSDVAILTNTHLEDGKAIFTFPNGDWISYPADAITTLQGKMNWIEMVRGEWVTIQDKPKKSKQAEPLEVVDVPEKKVSHDDPLEYAESQVEHFAYECECLASKIDELQRKQVEAQAAYKKWSKIVEGLKSDE